MKRSHGMGAFSPRQHRKWDALRDQGFHALGLEVIIKASGDFEVCTRSGDLVNVPGHIPSKSILRAVVRDCGLEDRHFGLGT